MPVILATDIILLLLFAGLAYTVLFGRKHESVQAVWAALRKNRLAMVSLIILALYASVGLLDSIRWRNPVTNDDGSITLTESGATIYSGSALSLLDRAASGLRERSEKTYSAPFAAKLFSKESIELADGTTIRNYPKLSHPRSHPLGTDKVGSDVLYAALKGVRTALVIGSGTTLIIVPFAILFGVIAGYYGGLVDDVIQYVYTTLSSIPGILLIVAFMLLFGDSGYQGGLISDAEVYLKLFVPNDRLFWLCLILGITSWTDLCRLIRGETLKLREMEYVQAARAFGVAGPGILWRHIVPNVMHLVLITFVLQFSALVLAEAVLSYIGIGVGAQMGSWGNMINTARLELSRDPVVWWNLAASFLFMFGLVLPANIFGDAIRDAMDPRLRYK